LIPALGVEGAADFQRSMTEYIVRQLRGLSCDVDICFSGGSIDRMQEWLGADLSFSEQSTGNLGERMHDAFARAFARGYKRVLIIGSDCPSNGRENIRHALSTLENHEVVLGPTYDGGYYTIGLSVLRPELFKGVDWGTDRVFDQTLARVDNAKVKLLNKLSDVDEMEDIPPKISVIIPTLNEERYLPETISHVQCAFHVEIIVVDSGSDDDTIKIAADAGCIVKKAEVRGNLIILK